MLQQVELCQAHLKGEGDGANIVTMYNKGRNLLTPVTCVSLLPVQGLHHPQLPFALHLVGFTTYCPLLP